MKLQITTLTDHLCNLIDRQVQLANSKTLPIGDHQFRTVSLITGRIQKRTNLIDPSLIKKADQYLTDTINSAKQYCGSVW